MSATSVAIASAAAILGYIAGLWQAKRIAVRVALDSAKRPQAIIDAIMAEVYAHLRRLRQTGSHTALNEGIRFIDGVRAALDAPDSVSASRGRAE